MVTGIEHTAIASPDPLALAQWYQQHLDFRINFQPPNTRTVFIRAANGSMIEIIESHSSMTGVPSMREPGLRHLALTVDDFDATYARLQAAGVSFLAEADKSNGNSLVFFTDPDGNILHLLQRTTPLP